MSLCVNTSNATPDGGKLQIVLENRIVDEVFSDIHLEARSGDYVVLQVTDSGSRTPSAIQEKVIELFFTAKEGGRGSTFSAYLPANFEADVQPLSDTELMRSHRGKGELILVADVEESIRTVARKTLERFG